MDAHLLSVKRADIMVGFACVVDVAGQLARIWSKAEKTENQENRAKRIENREQGLKKQIW